MLAAIVTLSQPELFSLHGLIPVTRQDWLAVQYNWAKLKRFESKGCLPHQGESYRGESSINTEVSVDPEPVCIILKPRYKRLEKDPEILKKYGTIIVDNKGSRVGEGPQGSLLASLLWSEEYSCRTMQQILGPQDETGCEEDTVLVCDMQEVGG